MAICLHLAHLPPDGEVARLLHDLLQLLIDFYAVGVSREVSWRQPLALFSYMQTCSNV